MKGTMLIIKPESLVAEESTLSIAPRMHELQRMVGGWLEAVPGFSSIMHGGQLHHCFALCNEEGKLDRSTFPGQTSRRGPLPPNEIATALYQAAAARNPLSVFPDILLGTVVVLFGDQEFMEAL
jgi:hypothetical protein